jgi:hypothetical protein
MYVGKTGLASSLGVPPSEAGLGTVFPRNAEAARFGSEGRDLGSRKMSRSRKDSLRNAMGQSSLGTDRPRQGEAKEHKCGLNRSAEL